MSVHNRHHNIVKLYFGRFGSHVLAISQLTSSYVLSIICNNYYLPVLLQCELHAEPPNCKYIFSPDFAYFYTS